MDLNDVKTKETMNGGTNTRNDAEIPAELPKAAHITFEAPEPEEDPLAKT